MPFEPNMPIKMMRFHKISKTLLPQRRNVFVRSQHLPVQSQTTETPEQFVKSVQS